MFALHCQLPIGNNSTTLTPQIFADSNFAEANNKSKMFMPYTQEFKTSDFENRKLERRNSSNSTPHLFLAYAGRESANRFEKRCLSLMQGEPLSDAQMISVAEALNKASDGTAKGKRSNTKLRHSLHISIFKKVLCSQHDSFAEEGDNGATPGLLLEPEESSTWETEFLKDQVKRQQEELQFLRLALRHLISSIGEDQEPIQRTEKESRNPVNALQAPAVQDRDILEQQGLPAIAKLPSIIEIPIDNGDDHSEQISELQSPSVIVLRNLSNKLKEVGNSAPLAEISPELIPTVSAYTLHNKLAVLQKTSAPRRPSYPMCIPASVIDLTNNEQCKKETDRTESMQLVVASRAEQNQRTYTFTDMVKGEVQEGRARGLTYRLHFEKRGVFVEGLYSGTIKGGLPHGTGVLRFANRDLYIGQFSEGNMHGEGSLLSRSKSKLCTFRGIFKNNEFVEPIATAKRISGSMVSVDVR